MTKKSLISVCGIIVLGIASGAAWYFSNAPDRPVASIHKGDSSHQPNTVYATTQWQADNTVDVSFNINEADAGKAFGAVLNIRYKGSELEYVSYDKGNYFNQAGSEINKKEAVYLVGDKAMSGDEMGEHRIAIGVSLFKGSPGMNGSGRLITLKFKPRQQAKSRLILTKRKVVDTTGKEITGISWPMAVQIIPS